MAKVQSVLRAALDAAEAGYPVFPVLVTIAGDGTKKVQPLGKWRQISTTDPDQLRRAWNGQANAYGIDTGKAGLCVVDLDTHNGQDGAGEWARLLPDSPEPVVGTPSGGQHVYFRDSSGELRNSAGKLAEGVDVRGNGGLVIGPGSVLTTGAYTGTLPRLDDVPEAPEALRALVRSTGTPTKVEETAPVKVPGGGRESLAELLQFPGTQGTRNDWLARVAGHYARSGLKFEDYGYLVGEAGARTVPPMEQAEVAAVVSSIWRTECEKVDPESERFQAEVAQELRRLQIRKEAQRRLNEASLAGATEAGMFAAGGDFMFDIPDGTPAVWGEGTSVLWAEGEALMLVGPTGVGKTTLAGQVVRARLGLGSGEVLGLPVAPTKSTVLYLAMDRPQQIARSLRRHFDASEHGVLNQRLKVRQGPPPQDVARNPETLLELAREVGADTVIVDSVKDAAVNLSSDEAGSGYNRARQMLLADGVEVLELHHQKKAHSDGSKPNDLNGVYGSAWITGGAGSVVLLWGEAGDLDLELVHLKQPAATVGPWRVRNDHAAGTTTRIHGADPLALLAGAGPDGLTATELAEAMGRDPRSDRDKQKSRRDLDRLTSEGLAEATKEPRGKQQTTVWRVSASGQGLLL